MQNTNWLRMSANKKQDLAKIGAALMGNACVVVSVQVRLNRYFILEHPSGAASWQYPRARSLCSMLGVEMSTFDQCTYGLASKLSSDSFELKLLNLQPMLAFTHWL